MRIGFALLAIVFVITLVIPSTREAHVLCLRLVFPAQGKTFVRGQPSGCISYTIPNVQFSDGYRAELIANANRSPNDFALAATTSEWCDLQFPPAQLWTNHPLLNWGALTCGYTASAYRTNDHDRSEAENIIKIAEAAQPDNGALWLAEALFRFDQHHDEAAVAALELAVKKTNWMTSNKQNFEHLTALYQDAGLSQLDATLAANLASCENPLQMIQMKLKSNLSGLMVAAIDSSNDDEFLNLLTLLVDLRKIDWKDGSTFLRNTFGWFGADDELFEAMRKRLGVESQTFSDYSKERIFREEVFRDYLARQTNQMIVGRFWGQADLAVTEKNLRGQMQGGFLFRREMIAASSVSLSGFSTALFLYVLFIVILPALPLIWLRRVGEIHGSWPKRPAFWVLMMASTTIGVVIGIRFFLNLGMFSEVGLMLETSKEMSPLLKSILLSLLLCGCFSLIRIVGWKVAKESANPKYDFMVLGCVYLAGIIAMAYFRSELVDTMLGNL
jgi:hypothetical protein